MYLYFLKVNIREKSVWLGEIINKIRQPTNPYIGGTTLRSLFGFFLRGHLKKRPNRLSKLWAPDLGIYWSSCFNNLYICIAIQILNCTLYSCIKIQFWCIPGIAILLRPTYFVTILKELLTSTQRAKTELLPLLLYKN